jgi:polysaccharide export outer membrane protein
MKAVNLIQNIGLATVVGLVFSLAIFAQAENPKTREHVTEVKAETKTDSTEAAKTEAKVEPTPAANTADDKNKTTDEPAEDREVLTYYNNYLKEYRLGPNDVISIEVFGQCPDYCKTGITVPPTARISYPLVREGVLVGGKTVEQIADEITKKLDEYIIDPKVTVTLDRAMSARYSVMGKVITPGIRILDRKVSLYEAIIEAGGVAKTGDKKKIALIRFDNQGKLTKQLVNLAEIESGKAPMLYLNPGDQVFVPGKGFTIDTVFGMLEKVSIVRLLFGSPF